MFLFKKKPKTQKLSELREQLKGYENTYCFDREKFGRKSLFNDGILIFSKVSLVDNDIVYWFKTTQNIDGYSTTLYYTSISVKRIKQMREDFLLLKAQLNHFGLEITKIEQK